MQRQALRLLAGTGARCSCAPARPRVRARRALASAASERRSVVDELKERGFIADLTSSQIPEHLSSPRTAYLGVDPSARSLHVGNLVAFIGLLHLCLGGHNVVALIGGATGAVGDPSGKSTERQALDKNVLQKNMEAITAQVDALMKNGVALGSKRARERRKEAGATPGKVTIANNLDWIGPMSFLDFLGGPGKFARMSTMLSRESVKSRLQSEAGLSFTEFTYQLLQAYDFLTLHTKYGCTIQLGGSDQLGNIKSGIDMIRRTKLAEGDAATDDPAYGITMPLLTTATGEKFGKSAGNAVWLDPGMTSPYELYQFLINTRDEDVELYLNVLTFLAPFEIRAILSRHKEHPNLRLAQHTLAREVTELIHGPKGVEQAEAATAFFFSKKATLSEEDLIEALEGDERVPSMFKRLKKSDVNKLLLAELALLLEVVPTKSQARTAIKNQSLLLNGVRLPRDSQHRRIGHTDTNGALLTLRIGTKVGVVVLED